MTITQTLFRTIRRTALSLAALLIAQQPALSFASVPPTVALDDEEQVFLDLINEYRADYGLDRLEASATISTASQWMSDDMASVNYLGHTDSLGRDPFTRMRHFKYNYSTAMGENVAAGNSTAEKTFHQWKNSPGHNSNMLSSSYKAIGIGRAFRKGSQYSWYWTTNFGGKVD